MTGASMDRADYARRYGPTVGDRVRLGDTDLWVEVEADDVEHGEEMLGGCGKTARYGALVTGRAGRDSALDLVILGVLLIDPVLGIRKTSIGVKDGRVVGVGRAGNPDVTAGVDLVVDAHTAMVPGEGLIATPGAVDSHVHLSNADLAEAALAAGVTTLVGMGIGGVWDVGANPATNLHTLMASWSATPVNAAFLARGSTSSPDLLEAAVEAGAGGFKVHEDWGAGPDAVDTCLRVAEAADLPVALHTDTLNESGFLADTLAAVGGRTVHAYHVEGGGGHPDLLQVVREPHVLCSSTTPTLPLTAATVAELGPMTRTVHRAHADVPSDLAIAASRIREHAIAAENALHDLGAISIVNSDALGMGRIGETVRRCWQLAHVNATLAGETGPDVANNARVLRYLAKLTENPARAHGLAAHVGSLAPGRLADVVLWSPAWFGAVPELVLTSGFVAFGAAGSGSGSTRLGQPRRMRAFHGGRGGAPARLAHLFVGADAVDLPPGASYLRIGGSRGLTSADMLHNTATPTVDLPGEPAPVRVDGQEIGLAERLDAARFLPLTRVHHLA